MTADRWWIALVTFERSDADQNILPEWALGACGWMAALAPDEEGARRLLIRDLNHLGLTVIEIADEHEVFSENDIEQVDDHLAANIRNFEPGKRTAWGTIHCYKGE